MNKKHHKNNKHKAFASISEQALKSKISKLLASNPKKRFSTKQIAKKLKIGNSLKSIQKAIDALIDKDIVFPLNEGRYRIKRREVRTHDDRFKPRTCRGIVDLTRHGSAFIMSDELDKDVYVPEKYLNSAMNGDLVEVSYRVIGNHRPEGSVIRVIKRSQTHFVGSFKAYKNETIAYVDNLKSHFQIHIPVKETMEAESGEKVVVEVTKWPDGKKGEFWGKVTHRLGKESGNDMEMNAILINNGFMISFPEQVITASEKLDKQIHPEEINKRRDFREVTTFTIDPDTAKDFDDALSIQYLKNGHVEIGIHIADVSHYVTPGGALDKEAYHRSTSVYLVDRVAPMLPEVLSNELCSLRPNEDKLCFSAVFEFDKDHSLVNEWFGKTIIHSDRRFTYEEAQEILENKKGDFSSELLAMHTIALRLRKEKFKHGAINFDVPELKFKLDENGKPLELFVKERKEAHMLVEDFMLLANKKVAARIGKKDQGKEIPFVYRIHDVPDPDRVHEFAKFALELGYKMQVENPKQIARSFNALSVAAKNDELLKMLEPLAIRTMAKAVYSTENIGHYGLAFEYYTHFTSPIRRYADVLVHRILEKNLKSEYRTDKEALEEQCKYISTQEKKAMDAERESIRYKQIEFLQGRIGEEFTGIISGMIEKGIFVELTESRAEGLIPFKAFDEHFIVDEGRYTATARGTGTVLKRGDRIRVRLTEINLDARQIELEPLELMEKE